MQADKIVSFAVIVHFDSVIAFCGFAAIPGIRNTIDIILNTVFNALDFNAADTAIIGDAFPLAIFPFSSFP